MSGTVVSLWIKPAHGRPMEAVAEADEGIFVSGEAIDRWLASWGTDKVLPMPEPDVFPDSGK